MLPTAVRRLRIDAFVSQQNVPPKFQQGKADQSTKCYPQPRGYFPSMLLYLSDEVVSVPIPPHFAPGVLRCSAIALRLGGVFVFFRRPLSSCVANNETLQQASAHSYSSSEISVITSLPLLPLLKLSCSCRYSISLLFECITDFTDVRSRARGRRSIRCQRAPRRAGYLLALRPKIK